MKSASQTVYDMDNLHNRARKKRKRVIDQVAQEAAVPDSFQTPPPPPEPPPLTQHVTQHATSASLMRPQPMADVHPFAPTLEKWEQGIQVDCGENWKWEVIEEAVRHGAHPSAQTPDSIALFADDIAYQQRAGFCQVFTWEELKRIRPARLKISPVAVVPQVGRRGRIILDLSFPVYQMNEGVVTVVQESVNDTTARTAPTVPVKEIGKVLQRLLHYMRDTPAGLHILFSKLDISDGFWRLVVREEDSFNFAYVLPQLPGQPTRIVVPRAVQMGWTESPPLFCAVTETARDVIQLLVTNDVELMYHPIERYMEIEDVPIRARADEPTELLQVYVDDFCNAATQSTDGSHIRRIRRASIHGIHSVFPPTNVTTHEGGKEPISEKKLRSGEGNFRSKKEMIGIEFDGKKRTVRLPADKARRYIKEAHSLIRRRSVPLKSFRTVVGQLRHATIILPAAKGFFTPLNKLLKSGVHSLVLGREVKSTITDICSLIHLLGSRPTHVRELVPDMPQYIAYHDAAAEGSGGVWFSVVHEMQPIVWREVFPPDIATDVKSLDNPTGTVTNSDLELAAEVLAVGVIMEMATTIKHVALGTFSDNTPTVGWIDRMASKSQSPVSGRLLRGLSYMLFWHHAGRLTTVHVNGPENVMADIASRPTKARALFSGSETTLSDEDFRSSFDLVFPLPNEQVWQLAKVPAWLKSNVFETLRGKQLDLRLWARPPRNDIGEHGRSIAGSTELAATGRRQQTRQKCSSLLLSPCGKVSTVTETRSRFSQCQRLSAPLPKSTFWTDIETHDAPLQPSTPLTSQLPDC